jgi:transcription-repair coupling factor (superfamily II helicase)
MLKNVSPLHPKLPKQPSGQLEWGNLYGCSKSLAITNAAKMHTGITLIVAPDTLSAHQLEQEIKFFTNSSIPTMLFPNWETLPYDTFSPHQDIISQRLKIFNQLPTLKHGILIASINTLMQRISPREYLAGHGLSLAIGQNIHLTEFRKELEKSGYNYVNQVIEHGEFSVRGSIIDLYPMGSEYPYRIDLFDDEIDSIRTFDPETQRSIEKIDTIALLPAHELPLTAESISLFRKKWRENFSGNPMSCPIYQDVSDSNYVPGIEYYLPLFFSKTASLFDYLPKETLVIRLQDTYEQAKKFWEEIKNRHEQLCHDIARPILPPKSIFLTDDEIFAAIKSFPKIRINKQEILPGTGKYNFTTLPPPDLAVKYKLKQPLQNLEKFISNSHSAKILFCAESVGRLEALLNLLNTIHLQPKQVNSWNEFLNSPNQICVIVAPIDSGLYCQDPQIILIAESQLYGKRVLQRRRRKQTKLNSEAVIRNLVELHINDPVVHIDHGVGRFLGLQIIKIGDQTDEYLTLEYAGNDKLYVPVSSLHLISRYGSTDTEHAPLHKLGTEQWEKIKRKAQKRVRDVAVELLDIHARRAAQSGYAFPTPDQNYLSFANAFPFEETPDQETAISQVIADMQSTKAMDRLICGDVGFGKTEVAMRAAFLAVQNNRQVAILVPTTLLAQQHYQNFKDRFADWPINTEVISRFRTSKEQQKIIKQLKEGKIDIIIGTHKLIQKNIEFKNLGLLVIDEEHRFGVQQKERLKSLRAEVDILTLTATPIPRTLNMAFSGIRDLSIIATPPEQRLSIKTFVQEKNNQIITEAISREILRGGQIYYLHNNVKTINKAARELENLIPKARIGIAHGQMPERELERTMMDFYHRRFNVLICTTIIETGIDVPSANTIIIERADKFGLAQLHQLRGRIGRSHHQAYAYLFIPPEALISRDAMKRLDAIASLEDLGAGFSLATHDMEIRGVGELLGEEQSGHMQAVGFNLYLEMLERAVKTLKSGKPLNLDKPLETGIEINLQIPALIPEDYLPDVHSRLILYKRIANAPDSETLDELRVEMIDRFGLLPDFTKNLFVITELKLKAIEFDVKKIDANSENIKLEFNENPNIDSSIIIKLIQTKPEQYKLIGSTKLNFTINTETAAERITAIEKLLDNFVSTHKH